MSDIDLLKKMTTQHFVAPLNEFRANTRGIDDTHTAHLNQFQNIINSLFASGDFRGQAADAIAEVAGKYIQAANSLSDAKEGLSEKLADASRVCETTAAEISHDLAILPDTDPTQSAGGTFSAFVVLGQKLPLAWEIIIGTGLAAAATTYIIVNGEQQNVLDDMSRAEERWETDMLNVAMEVEPKLPPNPTDPKPFLAAPGSILYPPATNSLTREQQLVQDIKRQLTSEGIPFNEADIEALVKLGYGKKDIIDILLAGIPTNLSAAEITKQLTDLDSRINEDQATFSLQEKRIAYILSKEGKTVVALPQQGGTGRKADALVDGVVTEFKTPDPGADSNTLRNEIQRSIKKEGQARNIIIDARNSGLTEAEARRFLARMKNLSRGKIDSIRIIGNGYDITGTDFN